MRAVVKPEEWAVNKRAVDNAGEMRHVVDGWTCRDDGFRLGVGYSRMALVRDVVPFVWFLKHGEMSSYEAHWCLQMTRFNQGGGRVEHLGEDEGEGEGIEEGGEERVWKRVQAVDVSFMDDEIED